MYIPTIGLEIHSILKTQTKMFCPCPNIFEESSPNKNICPICLGHPGVLPVINKKAVEAVIKLGMALGGEIAEKSHFDRKSYFYPDLPKGYQISQYEHPIVQGGMLNGVRIKRIHLEEDAGRLLHELPGSVKKSESATFVDFNRAGTPLLELVTEPDLKTAEEAVQFAKDLQLILRYLEISDADMERGQMRVEVNISVRKDSNDNLGTKIEVKNINSFKAVFGSIVYELKRQEKVLNDGKKLVQETRGWNDTGQITESQRSKESAHDYRYFPEPDLPITNFAKWDLERIRNEIPELPEAKYHRLMQEFCLSREQAKNLVEDKKGAEFFEEAASEFKTKIPKADYQLLLNYYANDLKGLMRNKKVNFDTLRKSISPEHFAHFVSFVAGGSISSVIAKIVLPKMFETGEDPEMIIKQESIKVIDGENELEEIVIEIINQNPKPVEDYKKGNQNSIQFLIGKAMAETRGRADPERLREILVKKLVS
ncbi:MAG: Asp-tRNA(Asn)/Glu-tRNA(Gln) amidotransferase subunit GatB [Patescibacteria group bacterium]|nr:Asp-tRNA(Asn)/Glu-tRNA(Gln) amidotransferase subunit GatB [Patescibacteria group bacterium]